MVKGLVTGVMAIVLSSSLVYAKEKEASKRVVASSGKTIACGDLQFSPPAKMGDLPNLDFSYPVNVTRFSFRDGNLLLVGMDQGESSRVRVLISAQLNAKSRTYIGQIFRDDGGNEIQLDNGPITCTVK